MNNIQKAQSEFIKLSHEAFEAVDNAAFRLSLAMCDGYSKAMKDIFGLGVWGEIVRASDLSFDKEVPVCAGIPLYSKFELQAQKAEANASEKDSNDMADFYIWAEGDLWVKCPGKENYWVDTMISGRILSTAELYQVFKQQTK